MSRISVILCTYNNAGFVAHALDSLCRQTLGARHYEVVFVDDGSTDDTEEIVRPYIQNINLRYFKNPQNLGLVASCNRGLQEAEGKYVIRLDADDWFEPTILKQMYKPLEQGVTDFVYSDRYEYLVDINNTRYVSLEDFNLFHLIAIGTMMRRDHLLEVGGYRPVFWEEYDMYIRYLTHSQRSSYYIPEPLLTYFIRPGSMTSDPDRVRVGWDELKRLWPPETLQRFGRLPDDS